MKVKDFLQILKGGIPTIRVIDANVPKISRNDSNGVMACEYLDNIEMFKNQLIQFMDCEVLHFNITHEVSHKNYKKLGLIPPFRPDLTPEYMFRDLMQKTYYDIHIDGATAADGWDKQEKE